MRSERTNVGLMVVLHANYRRSERSIFPGDDDYTEGRIEVSAGPALRRYATMGSKVNPFFYGHVLAGYVFLAQEGAGRPGRYTESGVSGALASGIGAEWFPVRSISLSGQTGLQLGANYMIGEGGTGETEGFSLFANTFTSSLSVNLYWPRHTR